MPCFHPAPGRALRACFMGVLLAGAALLTGCANVYVDGNTHEVPLAAMARPAEPRPVQLVVDFQTRGVTNARATAQTKAMIADSVRSTGLFSEVRDTPVEGAGLLSVTINNVPLTDDAAAKGFIAGLTFGAAGQQVTDGYVCTVSYLAPGQSRPIVKTARHAIHTTVGAAPPPPNAWKAPSVLEAVRTMVRQVMSVTLNDLSHDAEFK
jgi:hypothetical protein